MPGGSLDGGGYQRPRHPMIQGRILIAITFVFVNLIVDLIYAYVDPRIRYQ
jgi:ABC-type dipeptide/oligopeptide/nickel transport system permease component